MTVFTLLILDDGTLDAWFQAGGQCELALALDAACGELKPDDDSGRSRLAFLRCCLMSRPDWPEGEHCLQGEPYDRLAEVMGHVNWPPPALLVKALPDA